MYKHIQVTETANKRWKVIQVFGGLVIAVGFAWLLLAMGLNVNRFGPLVLILVVGGPLWIVGRLGVWWHRN